MDFKKSLIIVLLLVFLLETNSNPIVIQKITENETVERYNFKNCSSTAEYVCSDDGKLYKLAPTINTAGIYAKGAVAASSKVCAQVGADVLNEGGSAVDAAIATLLCDGIINPQASGIGGGFLMNIWDAKTKKAYFLKAREMAPQNLSVYYTGKVDKFRGPLSIAVPGEIKGYWEAHKRFGKLPWARLLQPAIRLCRKGIKVSKYLANSLNKVAHEIDAWPEMKKIVYNETKKSMKDYNDIIKRPQLARTLRKIAIKGADEFYKGTIGQNIVSDIKKLGGVITMKDFEDYTVEWSNPTEADINGYKMYTSSVPGSGPILAYMMNILKKLVPSAPNDKVLWQRIIETMKWGYARRIELGDIDELNREIVEPVIRNLTSQAYADETRSKIEDDRTYNDLAHYLVEYDTKADAGTAHTSILAPDGSAVSVTATINHILGSMVVSPSTGIILNDEMEDFSYPGEVNGYGAPYSKANECYPKKRPMSSKVPTIIVDKDNRVRLIIGSAGGTKITSGVVIGIVLNLFKNVRVKEALEHPRIHNQLFPMATQAEEGFSPEILDYLESIGHKLEGWLITDSTLSAIEQHEGKIHASGDYRREGSTAGF